MEVSANGRLYRFLVILCRLFTRLAHLFRNVRLDVLNFSYLQSYLQSSEPRHVVISRSFWFALSRCFLHVPPLAVSLFLIIINWRGHYIGSHLLGANSGDGADSVVLALIQVAAKLQELLVVASVGDVLMHTTINCLLHDDGLPLGLAVSGFCFVRVSYFWSATLLGGIFGLRDQKTTKTARIVCLILLGGLLAITAGPASAVLMLPRTTRWQQFTTTFWLNGSSEVFWPSKLSATHLGGASCADGLVAHRCVSSGLPLLLTTFDYNYGENTAYDEISAPDLKYPRIIQWTPKVPGETWSFAPHVATSLFMTQLWADPHWYPLGTRYTGDSSGQTAANAAAVRTVCSPDIKVFDNNTLVVALPALAAYQSWSEDVNGTGNFHEIHLSGPLWGSSNQSLTTNKHPTTVFIPPSRGMSSVTTGVVFMGPVRASGDRIGMVCSVDARWIRAMHKMTQKPYYGHNMSNPIRVSVNSSNSPQDIISGTLLMNTSDWRHIDADSEWLEGALGYKTGFVDALQPRYLGKRAKTQIETTALGAFLMIVGKDVNKNSTSIEGWGGHFNRKVEPFVSTAFADAVSRIGSSQQLETSDVMADFAKSCTPLPRQEEKKFCPGPGDPMDSNFTRLSLNGSATGYAYKAARPTDFISIAVLLLYIMIATVHVLVLLVTRRKSTCWDTIEELLLLAKSSAPSYDHVTETMPRQEWPDGSPGFLAPPSGALPSPHSSSSGISQKNHASHNKTPNAMDNTSAGIQSFRSMGLRARIRALPPLSSQSEKSSSEVKPYRTGGDFEVAGNTSEEMQLLIAGDNAGDYLEKAKEGRNYGRRW